MELSKNRIYGLIIGLSAGNKNTVNLSSEKETRNSYIKFMNTGLSVYDTIKRKIFDATVKDLGLTNFKKFGELFRDESVVNAIHADTVGKTIKFKYTKEEEEYNTLKKELSGMCTFNEEDVEDPDSTFVVRNADGLGLPMFVTGEESLISKMSHKLAAWYHYQTNTPYYDARPIRYITWKEHPETQLQTRGFEEE